MTEELLISGFGGQGVLSMGKILAYAAMTEGKEVTWMPAYGPEQRGGTANVTVIVSDEKISSPVLSAYDTAIVLNQPSLDKFEPRVKPGGVLIYDAFGVNVPPTRTDIRIYKINAMDVAAELKMMKAFNMVVLGAYLKVRPILKSDDIVKALEKTLPQRHHNLIPMNRLAILKGMELID
jgi:2-oxoglutarate ferredoxin oxidoreductase subunit gamma